MKRWALLAVLAGCEVATSRSESAIVGGVPAPDDTAVLALARRSTSCEPGATPLVCTGTLVARRAVVTAAHCLEGAPVAALEVFFGPVFGGTGTRIAVIGGAAHPDFDATTHANDIAVLILGEDAPATIAPISIAGPLSDLNGMDVRLVGFGVTTSAGTDVGERRAGIARVTGMTSEELRMVPGPAMSCQGDSGGPVLLGTQLVGVTSYGDPACTQFGAAMRIDRHAAFIQPILDEAAAPPPRRPFDPDEPLCAVSCETDADCPAETVCSGGRCSYHGLPAAELGAACAADGACSCVALPDGSCRELRPCVTEGESTCRAADPGCGCSSNGGAGGTAVLALATLLLVRARTAGRTARR